MYCLCFIISGKKVETPFIDYTEQLGGSVELYHAVELKCTTPDADIYYTIDGSTPYPWHKSAKVSPCPIVVCEFFNLMKCSEGMLV